MNQFTFISGQGTSPTEAVEILSTTIEAWAKQMEADGSKIEITNIQHTVTVQYKRTAYNQMDTTHAIGYTASAVVSYSGIV